MSKKNLKDIFDEKWNKQEIHESIITKLEGKRENKMNKILKLALPVFVVAMVCTTMIWNNHDTKILKPVTPTQKEEENNIVINNIKKEDVGLKIDAKRLDAQSNYYNIPRFEMFEELEVPKDMNEFGALKLYGREDKNGEYDKLIQYEYHYFNEDSSRSIKVAFSDTNKPIRDYHFSDSGKNSTIHNVTLKLYQYEDSYMTEFSYNGYNFDIETSGITEEEFIAFLKSLIK